MVSDEPVKTYKGKNTTIKLFHSPENRRRIGRSEWGIRIDAPKSTGIREFKTEGEALSFYDKKVIEIYKEENE
jgi:hypothetical protein